MSSWLKTTDWYARRVLRHRRLLLVGLITFASPGTTSAQDNDSRWVPVPYAARPLTLVDGLFRLDFFVGGGQIDRTDIAFDLSAGASYGVTDDLELGLELLTAVVSPSADSGLQEPNGYIRYRFLGLRALQAAIEARGQIPLDGRLRFSAALPALVSIADVARLDLLGEISATQSEKWVTRWRADAFLSVQIVDQLRLFGGARMTDGVAGPFRPLLSPAGGAAFTLVSDGRPSADIELSVQVPAVRLADDATVPRDLDSDWFVVVAYRPFIRTERSRRSDPFSDPEGW